MYDSKHLQQVILNIAKDIDILCKKNNITYFLDGGTALGAIRHKGFIPWDDDFDIIILPEDYNRFVEMCRTQLDTNKYIFEEALIDWPLHISKIKLLGTRIDEVDAYPSSNQGIYIDVFCFDNASDYAIIRYWQYICARIWVAYLLTQKPYTTHNIIKKIILKCAGILKITPIRNFIRNQSKSKEQGKYLSMAWCRKRSNWKRYFCPRDFFDHQVNAQFEDYQFPVANNVDGYLKTCFGNYMKLPPVEKRVGLHIKNVDFGKY